MGHVDCSFRNWAKSGPVEMGLNCSPATDKVKLVKNQNGKEEDTETDTDWIRPTCSDSEWEWEFQTLEEVPSQTHNKTQIIHSMFKICLQFQFFWTFWRDPKRSPFCSQSLFCWHGSLSDYNTLLPILNWTKITMRNGAAPRMMMWRLIWSDLNLTIYLLWFSKTGAVGYWILSLWPLMLALKVLSCFYSL